MRKLVRTRVWRRVPVGDGLLADILATAVRAGMRSSLRVHAGDSLNDIRPVGLLSVKNYRERCESYRVPRAQMPTFSVVFGRCRLLTHPGNGIAL